MKMVTLCDLMPDRVESLDPAKYPDEMFDLYSIPSHDQGEPEVCRGADIGSTKKLVRPGDILLSRIVPHIRRVCIVGPERSRRQIASGEWIVFRNADICPSYLRYSLLSDKFHKQFMQTVAGVGGSLLRARPSGVERLCIPIPSVAEQKRIAGILDKADAIRRKRRQALQLADDFLRSTFLEMFGDPITNPKSWPRRAIGEGLKSIEAGTSVSGEPRERLPNEYGVLKVSAVTWGEFAPDECKVVAVADLPAVLISPRKGDLLFSRANTRDLVCATCIVTRDEPQLFLPDKLWRINTDECALSKVYLKGLFSNKAFQEMLAKEATGTSGSMLNISQEKVRASKAPFPPIGIQKQYEEVFWANFKLKQKLIRLQTYAETFFTALSQRAFSGSL